MKSYKQHYRDYLNYKEKDKSSWSSFLLPFGKSKWQKLAEEELEHLKIIVCSKCNKSISINDLSLKCPYGCGYVLNEKENFKEREDVLAAQIADVLKGFVGEAIHFIFGKCPKCKREIQKISCIHCDHIIDLNAPPRKALYGR